MTHARKSYIENSRKLATEAFSEHEIVSESEGRWLLRRPAPNSAYHWTEVIALAGNGLLVDGDIDPVIFRYGPKHPEARVRWMARTQGADDRYFREKASIGGTGPHIMTWRDDVARDDLSDLQKEAFEDGEDEKHAREIADALEEIKESLGFASEHDVNRALYESNIYDGCDLPRVGTVPSTRLFSAHAALVRLADLLDARDS
jgi:hypothetical protein